MSTLKTSQQPDPNDIRTELDNHVDTSIVNPGAALIFHDFECPVKISRYDGSVGSTEAQGLVLPLHMTVPQRGTHTCWLYTRQLQSHQCNTSF